MLISYASYLEVLVCEEKDEKEMISLYFSKKTGRDIFAYDRKEIDDVCVKIISGDVEPLRVE